MDGAVSDDTQKRIAEAVQGFADAGMLGSYQANRWAAFTDEELAEMQLSLTWRYDASDEVNAGLLRQVKAELARRHP